jgi:hypothetical protein
MKKILTLFLIGLLLYSCQKKQDNPTVIPKMNTSSYQPSTAGSCWVYPLDSTRFDQLDTIQATTQDTVIDGSTYKVFVSKKENKKSYFRKFEDKYYQYNFKMNVSNLSDSLNALLGNVKSVKLLYLKDNLKVGDTWHNQFSNNSFNFRLIYTVVEKGGTKIVNGVTYNDVIGIHAALFQTVFLMGIPFNGLDDTKVDQSDFTCYYANNVGLISTSKGQKLLHYEIK